MVSWVHLISGEFTLNGRFTGFSNMQKIKKDKSIGIFYSACESLEPQDKVWDRDQLRNLTHCLIIWIRD